MENINYYVEKISPSNSLLKIIGFLVILKQFLKICKSIYRHCLRWKINLPKRYGKNSWALITGSSQGIGKAFAQSLAKRGFSIILTARTEDKLIATSDELKKDYPQIEVRYVIIDFKRSDFKNYLKSYLEHVIKDLNLSIVINNVGMDVLQPFQTLSATQISDLIKLNCTSMAILSNLCLPYLKNRCKDRNVHSALINVSSVAAQIPMPLHNIYCASKSFVDILSRALSYEYPEIDIISLRPSEVSTPMTCNKQIDILTISANDCVEGLLKQLGYERVSHGYWTHALQSFIYSCLPESLFNCIWGKYIGPSFMKERDQKKRKRN